MDTAYFCWFMVQNIIDMTCFDVNLLIASSYILHCKDLLDPKTGDNPWKGKFWKINKIVTFLQSDCKLIPGNLAPVVWILKMD